MDGEMISGNGDHYEVQWYYGVDGVWFDGGSSSVKMNNATYSVPTNATRIKVTVKPVSKTYTSGDSEVSYWSSEETTVEMNVADLPPNQLSAPTVTIEKYQLKAEISNIEDAKCQDVEFEVVKGNDTFTSGKTTVKTARATFTCTIDAGSSYRVRCRAINYINNQAVYGEWSQYSSETDSIPGIPTNVKVEVESTTSVKVSWDSINTATSYKVEYATNKLYFDASSEVKSQTVETNYVILTGLESGHDFYFRVQAINSKGSSGWSDIINKIVGTKPEAPTTWSLTTTAIIGDPVTLYWTHNSEDASKQYEAQIELVMNGKADIITIDTSEVEVKDNETKIYSYDLDLTSYTEGVEIYWRVRTRGVSYEYSDWSIQRKINTYAPPTLTITAGNNTTDAEDGYLKYYPYYINLSAGPAAQQAISYHISIYAEASYITEDTTGKKTVVNAGEEVYSKNFTASSNQLSTSLQPSDCILENNEPYSIKATVSMNSGLTATAESRFTVSWDENIFYPDARIAFDKKSLCCYVNPYCYDESYNIVEDVVLSVYRREFNGQFTEIATDIPNTGSVSVTDPHPALDYARYRVVARGSNTNVVNFADIPGIPTNVSGTVIQWDEQYSSFDVLGSSDAVETPFMGGSMVHLPFNLDVSESSEIDSSLVEYIGRESPVSYYGTQKGLTFTASTDVIRSDKETLYALRRLQNWAGDVYIREQNGLGYNAFVTVTFTTKHDDLTIPVSITVKKVEGGI